MIVAFMKQIFVHRSFVSKNSDCREGNLGSGERESRGYREENWAIGQAKRYRSFLRANGILPRISYEKNCAK